MNFRSEIHGLEEGFKLLQERAASTAENWNDPVKTRFYGNFIDDLPKDFGSYIQALSQLNNTFEKPNNTSTKLPVTMTIQRGYIKCSN